MMQRGFVVPVMLIVYAVAALAFLGTVAMVKHKVETWCNTACKDARAERDVLAAEKKEALRQAAAIAVKYGEQVAATQAAENHREVERYETFAAIQRAAVGAGAGVRLPAAAARVLADATDAANAAGAPARTDQAAAPTAPAADLVGWYVQVAEIHAECRDRVAAWEKFYAGLRAATEAPLEQIH